MWKTIQLLFILLFAVACSRVPTAVWTEGTGQDDGQALHTLVLNDVPKDSRVWFQELFDGKTFVEGPSDASLSRNYMVYRHPEERHSNIEILRTPVTETLMGTCGIYPATKREARPTDGSDVSLLGNT